MEKKDVKCPLCGHLNRCVDLDETGGWVECEQCGSDFAPGECLDKVLQSTYPVPHSVDILKGDIKNGRDHPIL